MEADPREGPDTATAPDDFDPVAAEAAYHQLTAIADDVRTLLGQAREVAQFVAGGGVLDEVLDFYAALDDAARDLKSIATTVGTQAIGMVPDRFGEYRVPSGGVFKVSGGRERKRYDGPRLVSVFAQRLREHVGVRAVVDADGEVVDPDAHVHAIVTKAVAFAGGAGAAYSGWRSGVAKEVGLNLNDYAELEETPVKPRLEGRSPV